MMIPSFVFLSIFSYVPMAGNVIAFQKINPVKRGDAPWVGLDNYRDITGD